MLNVMQKVVNNNFKPFCFQFFFLKTKDEHKAEHRRLHALANQQRKRKSNAEVQASKSDALPLFNPP